MLLFVVSMNAKDTNVVWNNPSIGYNSNFGDGFFKASISVTKVEMSKKETLVYVKYEFREDNQNLWFSYYNGAIFR